MSEQHHMTLGSATEAIRRVLAWPPDASYEGRYADARKGLNALLERLSGSERKRYDAEREVERLREIVATTPPQGLPYAMLVAAWGESAAATIWNAWSPADRDAASLFADENFGSVVRELAERLAAWGKERLTS